MEKSRNLGLVGASTTDWQLIPPRGGLARPPPHGIGLKKVKDSKELQICTAKASYSHCLFLDLNCTRPGVS